MGDFGIVSYCKSAISSDFRVYADNDTIRAVRLRILADDYIVVRSVVGAFVVVDGSRSAYYDVAARGVGISAGVSAVGSGAVAKNDVLASCGACG